MGEYLFLQMPINNKLMQRIISTVGNKSQALYFNTCSSVQILPIFRITILPPKYTKHVIPVEEKLITLLEIECNK
jgi:hypothetical protein